MENMQQTVSENFLFILNIDNTFEDTLDISRIHLISGYTSNVKIFKIWNNPLVTKAFNSQVGTSEAIRLLSINSRLFSSKGLNNH
jgi:hypothetical protein